MFGKQTDKDLNDNPRARARISIDDHNALELEGGREFDTIPERNGPMSVLSSYIDIH